MNKGRSFEFITGTVAFDFVDTLAGRATTPMDLLHSGEALDSWIKLASSHGRLPICPSSKAREAQLDLARELREAIYRAARAASDKKRLPADDIDIINRAARVIACYPQLIGGAVVVTAEDDVYAALSLIARDAIHCLSDANISRIRRCPGCQMLFIDQSRPGRRRWCSSARGCGNQAKLRRHRARHGDAASA